MLRLAAALVIIAMPGAADVSRDACLDVLSLAREQRGEARAAAQKVSEAMDQLPGIEPGTQTETDILGARVAIAADTLRAWNALDEALGDLCRDRL